MYFLRLHGTTALEHWRTSETTRPASTASKNTPTPSSSPAPSRSRCDSQTWRRSSTAVPYRCCIRATSACRRATGRSTDSRGGRIDFIDCRIDADSQVPSLWPPAASCGSQWLPAACCCFRVAGWRARQQRPPLRVCSPSSTRPRGWLPPAGEGWGWQKVQGGAGDGEETYDFVGKKTTGN